MTQLFTLRELPKYETIARLADRFPQLTIEMVQTWLVCLKTSSDMMLALEAHAAQYGLSSARFTALMHLYHSVDENLAPSVLADRMGVTRATMTGLLDGLESCGLLVREPQCDDRRAFILRLTPKGRCCVEKILPHHFDQVARLLGNLTADERQTLQELLNKLRDHLPSICGDPLPELTKSPATHV